MKSSLVAAYVRLSKEDEIGGKESGSIKNQKEIIEEYAKDNGLQIQKFYIDDGYSGGNFERPAFKQMILDTKNSKTCTIITKDTSRLGRDFVETSYYIFKYFPENNIRYIAILENFDTFNPNGVEDIIPFQNIMNDMYLKDISKKIKSVKHNKMVMGEYVGSTVPYGYKKDKSNKYKFVIDEYASKVIKYIFKMKLSGHSSLSIANKLTSCNILPPSMYSKKNIKITKTTNIWKASTIDNILKNEIYIGTLIQGKYTKINYKSKKKIKIPNKDWIRFENFTYPIIDKDTFFKIQKEYIQNDKLRKSKHDYILKGMVWCKDCNHKMTIRRRQNGQPYYACTSNIKYGRSKCSLHYFKEDKLNSIIVELVTKELKIIDKSRLKSIICKVNERNRESIIQQIKENEEEYYKLNEIISKIYIDKANKIINDEEFKFLKNSIDIKKCNIVEKLKNLKSKLNSIDIKSNLKIDINSIYTKDLILNLINNIVDKIEIDENRNVTVYF